MAPTLTIEFPHVSSRQCVLSVDGDILRTTSKAVIRELGLQAGEIENPLAVVTLISETEPAVAMQRALTLLSYRDRSRAEVVRMLSSDGYPHNVIEAVCSRLTASGLLDEDRYIEGYVRMKQAAGWGFDRIRRGLTLAGIEADKIALMCQLVPDEEYKRALDVARRKPERLRADASRLAAALIQRGFCPDIARRAARVISAAEYDNDLDASTCQDVPWDRHM